MKVSDGTNSIRCSRSGLALTWAEEFFPKPTTWVRIFGIFIEINRSDCVRDALRKLCRMMRTTHLHENKEIFGSKIAVQLLLA